MATTTLKAYVIAAAIALTAVAASAPAFAWGAGAPTNSYDQTTQGSGYYDYAPGATHQR